MSVSYAIEHERGELSAARADWRTLGALWILYGFLRLAVAAAMVVWYGVATVMFGALLSRVGNPYFWMDLFHFFYAVAICVAILAGIFGLIGGAALATGRASGRKLSIVAALFSVSDLPLGTTLGIYTLISFLR
jgi:hypothetical protein